MHLNLDGSDRLAFLRRHVSGSWLKNGLYMQGDILMPHLDLE